MKLREILCEQGQLRFRISDITWASERGTPQQLYDETDVPRLQKYFDEKYPGVKFKVDVWYGSAGGWPDITIWGPPAQMEKFVLDYNAGDEDEAEDMIQDMEKFFE